MTAGKTGAAKGAEVEAVGLARAKAFQAQVEALGQSPTALVNAITVLAERGIKLVPDTLVMSGGGSGAVEGLAASLMGYFGFPGQLRPGSRPGGDGPRGRQRTASVKPADKKEPEIAEVPTLPVPSDTDKA